MSGQASAPLSPEVSGAFTYGFRRPAESEARGIAVLKHHVDGFVSLQLGDYHFVCRSTCTAIRADLTVLYAHRYWVFVVKRQYYGRESSWSITGQGEAYRGASICSTLIAGHVYSVPRAVCDDCFCNAATPTGRPAIISPELLRDIERQHRRQHQTNHHHLSERRFVTRMAGPYHGVPVEGTTDPGLRHFSGNLNYEFRSIR